MWCVEVVEVVVGMDGGGDGLFLMEERGEGWF
jgi:hypothetical protein